jgi:predicted nucleotidyltransferase
MASDETTVRSTSILREVVQRLVSAYEPERIYLFGSTGRGETQLDSDLDLMV